MYRPQGGDVLLDFSCEHLKRANDILKFAATKLELEGHSIAGDSSEKALGEQLRDARRRAGHSQREAADKIGYDHKASASGRDGSVSPTPTL